MRTVALIQARTGSTRFPNKVLQDLCGKPLLAHVVERVKAIKGLNEIHVATAGDRDVKALSEAAGCWVASWANDSADVLARLRSAARYFAADVVLRVTSDCPLLAPDLCERVMADRGDAPYCWNGARGYVDGTDCEALTIKALDHAHLSATSMHDREHVTTWIRRHYPVVVSPPRGEYSQHKWSVDTPDDLDRVRRIMTHVRGLNFADTLAAATEAGV